MMTERFVYGFVVSVESLQSLVGSRLDAGALLADVSDEYVEMFDDEFDSSLSLVSCANEVLAGDLDEDHTYPYTRVVEPLLTVVAEPLGMIHMALTYYLPNDSFGRWNPVLKALGLDRLAALWAAANTAFPWPRGHTATADWPCITELSPAALAEISAELAGGWRTRLAALPESLLADDDSLAADSRAELDDGLSELARWVERAAGAWSSHRQCVAPSGNALILVMDGGQ